MGLPADRATAGFTLLEVLIAFAIAAITLAVVINGSLTALSAARIARDTQNAIVRARSRLAALEGGGLRAGEQSGDDGGGFSWRTRITEMASATDTRTASTLPAGAPTPRATLYGVEVVVSWTRDGGERSVTLDSTRLAAASP
jgi:general secretion pathway protein I